MLHVVWQHIICRHMKIEQKHLALLEETDRRGLANADSLRLCFEFLSLARAIDRDCAARLAPYGLSESKFVLLFLLHGRDAGLSPHELADRAGVTRATMTGLLDGMARDGFLSRKHDHEDRRRVTVRLTGKGQAAAKALFHEHSLWIASLMDGLTVAERDELARLLGLIWQRTDAGAVSDD